MIEWRYCCSWWPSWYIPHFWGTSAQIFCFEICISRLFSSSFCRKMQRLLLSNWLCWRCSGEQQALQPCVWGWNRLWQFGRCKPRLGGLNVMDTEERKDTLLRYWSCVDKINHPCYAGKLVRVIEPKTEWSGLTLWLWKGRLGVCCKDQYVPIVPTWP